LVNKRTGGAMLSPSSTISSNRMVRHALPTSTSSSLISPGDLTSRIETIKETMDSFTTLETSPSSSSWPTPHRTNTSSHPTLGTSCLDDEKMNMRPVVDSDGKILFEV
jgi:hypothetical protein